MIPNASIQSVKEDKSERGTVTGYAVTFSTNRSAAIGMAHFREAVISPEPAVGARIAVKPTA